MKLDPNALEALEAVVDCGSVSGAAEALNKAQSAISYHLRRLEEQLAIAVFDRSGYRLKLTAEGEAILAEARPILRKLRDLGRYAAKFESGWEPELRIFFDGALPTGPIITALRQIEAQGAPTRIDLRVGFLDGVQDAFIRSNGDILIASIVDPQPDLAVAGLPSLDFILCCAASHPLARGRAIEMADLHDQTELIVPDQRDEPALPAHHFRSRRVFHLCDFHTKYDAIRQGLGFGWLPRYMAATGLASGELTELDCAFNNLYRLSPSIATWSGARTGRAGKVIVEQLRLSGWESEGSDHPAPRQSSS